MSQSATMAQKGMPAPCACSTSGAHEGEMPAVEFAGRDGGLFVSVQSTHLEFRLGA